MGRTAILGACEGGEDIGGGGVELLEAGEDGLAIVVEHGV